MIIINIDHAVGRDNYVLTSACMKRMVKIARGQLIKITMIMLSCSRSCLIVKGCVVMLS